MDAGVGSPFSPCARRGAPCPVLAQGIRTHSPSWSSSSRQTCWVTRVSAPSIFWAETGKREGGGGRGSWGYLPTSPLLPREPSAAAAGLHGALEGPESFLARQEFLTKSRLPSCHQGWHRKAERQPLGTGAGRKTPPPPRMRAPQPEALLAVKGGCCLFWGQVQELPLQAQQERIE